tara:strand:+ start:85 stop:285 length:201 start_codon:yes stop_codon:yes gene_type:complete
MGINTKDPKEYLHSDRIHEDDSVFDPGGKIEYTEEQLIRFAKLWQLEWQRQAIDDRRRNNENHEWI